MDYVRRESETAPKIRLADFPAPVSGFRKSPSTSVAGRLVRERTGHAEECECFACIRLWELLDERASETRPTAEQRSLDSIVKRYSHAYVWRPSAKPWIRVAQNWAQFLAFTGVSCAALSRCLGGFRPVLDPSCEVNP
jgi:hypothetical protein